MPENNFSLSLQDGTFFQNGDKYGVRFQRAFDHPVAVVWKDLTDPVLMAQWLAPAAIQDGNISLQMTGGSAGGRILQWQENSLLEYIWQEPGTVTWQLVDEGGNRCRLLFSHNDLPQTQLEGAAIGWHYHLDVLALTLDGQAPPKDAPKQWEEISHAAALRYKKALQEFPPAFNPSILF